MSLMGKSDSNARHDWREIDKRLRNDVERLVTLLVDEQPNRQLSKAHETRWGRKGGLAAVTQGPDVGRITAFDGDGRGKSPFQFIQERLNCRLDEAVAWAAEDFLGMCSSDKELTILTFPTPEKKAEMDLADLESAVKRDERIKWAQDRYNRSVPASGTLAATYLVKRGIDCDLPVNVRFVQKTGDEGFDALLVPATDIDGNIVAVQRIFIGPLGSKAPVSTPKRTNGSPKDGAFRIAGDLEGPLYLAEGPENGLSVWMATGSETWVTLGSISGIEQQLPTGRRIIIARDGDAPGSSADKTLENSILKMVCRGIDVSVTTPSLGNDANDILRYKGIEALRQHLEDAVQRYPLEPCYPPRIMALEDAESAVAGGLERFCKDVPPYWANKQAHDDWQADLAEAA